MAIPDRAQIRQRLAAIIEADGTWKAVYDHQPKTFGGVSPTATVHGGGVELPQETFGDDEDVTIELIVTSYVERSDADAAEDTLDGLLTALLGLLVEHRREANYWDNLFVRGPTEPDYYVVDGKPYRAEAVHVAAEVYV